MRVFENIRLQNMPIYVHTLRFPGFRLHFVKACAIGDPIFFGRGETKNLVLEFTTNCGITAAQGEKNKYQPIRMLLSLLAARANSGPSQLLEKQIHWLLRAD